MPRPYKTPGGIVTSSIALILAVTAVVAGFVVNQKFGLLLPASMSYLLLTSYSTAAII